MSEVTIIGRSAAIQTIDRARERLVATIPQLRPGHRAYPWAVMIAISVGITMPFLDSTVVNVAIAKLEVAFGATTDAVQWVITAYILAFAVMLSASGWLVDRFGYKRLLLLGIVIFTAGSILCGLSWNLGSLVFFRIVQGIGGGIMGPLGGAIIRREFPKEKLGLAIGFFTIPSLSSTSFGPTLGGWIIDRFSWQLIFDINVPIGILAIVAVYVVVRNYPLANKHAFDIAGFSALSIALGSILLALADGNAAWNTDGWGSSFVIVCFGVSAAAFAAFFAIELTTDHPLIDFSLFKTYNFSMGMVIVLIFGLGIFGSDFLLPLYLQVGLGYTPTAAGLIFVPYGFVMIAANLLSGRITDLVGGKIPAVMGIVLRAYGMYRFVFLSQYSSNSEIIVTVCIAAAGMGLMITPLQTTIMASSPVAKAAQASGMMQIVRQLGGSFGVAVLSSILMSRQVFHLAVDGEMMSQASPVYGRVVAGIARYAQVAIGGTSSDATSRAKEILVSYVQAHAFVSSIDDAFFVTLLVSIASSIPFLFLKSARAKKAPVQAAPAKLPKKGEVA